MTVVLTALALFMPMTHASDHRWRVVRPYNAKLERMAWCEWGYSRPRWHGNTGNGFYGGLQFTLSTWKSVRGRGYPHRNSKLEQKYRAVLVIKKNHGYGDWPICGKA